MTATSTPARLKPDSKPIAYGAVALAASIYLGAFATSFFGQAVLAAHMSIPAPLQYVVPAVVDLALVLFTMATLVRKSRGETTLWTNLATGFWTLVSITANILHVIVPAGESWTLGVWVGAGLSALMPVSALGASLVIENVLIERARGAQEPVKAAEVQTPAPAVLGPQKPAEPLPVTAERTLPPVHAKRSPLAVVPDPVEQQPAPAETSPAGKPEPAAAQHPAVSEVPVFDSLTAAQDGGSSWKEMSKEERAARVGSLKAEGHSSPEIADRLGTSLSSVKRSTSDLKELQPAA